MGDGVKNGRREARGKDERSRKEKKRGTGRKLFKER